MADLTSTLRIQGTIGGRVVNFSHTYTISDVYDVALRSSGHAFNYDSFMGEEDGAAQTQNVFYFQDTPNYLAMAATHPQFPTVFNLETSGTNDVRLVCAPGAFVVLHANTAMISQNTTNGGTTLNDVENIGVNALQGFPNGQANVMAVFNAVT